MLYQFNETVNPVLFYFASEICRIELHQRSCYYIIIVTITSSSRSNSSSSSTSSCLSLIYNLISILGDFFLVWRLLFTKSRYLQVNNLLWYYSWAYEKTKIWVLGIIFFSMILFRLFLHFPSLSYPSKLFPLTLERLIGTEIQIKYFFFFFFFF